ncbi:Permease of the drug/metabolite transporter (DMT) superfamily [Candidatus Rhodobacter oscarellae]|uniref:Permease of the drug/metabolite transporter (DMT) superfamily n=1 Tax=Candidatus Rhodobacter oscarellae TaxID=1675527 RepID=A0A0J9E2X5_9RHOB|nr:DMT family transporter [Candidatus Rhodobacter lobularis]KMW57057.1 Permease of the drug/metabolite transporter (DMT) superfamily [Candidatus Rhodobacter lobularis]
MTRNATLWAIALYLLAILLFDFMGLVIKRLAGDYTAAELSAYRNIFGMIPAVVGLWMVRSWHAGGRRLRIRQWRLALLRGGIVVFAQLSFYTALVHMDFATATTISYAMALFMVGFAVPILGEQVGWVRWAAVLVGFAGVVLVMGVGRDAFSSIAILPVIAAALYALTGITSRLFDEEVPSALMNLYSALTSAIGAALLALLLGGFSPIQGWGDLGWIVIMGGFGGAAVLTMVVAFRMTEQSNLAPFSYFGIPLAFGLGWLFYDEAPWADLFPGALLIIASGLLIIWRERRAQS